MGPFLPLVVGAISEQPFRKDHARQALVFQLGFSVLWVVAVGSTIVGEVLPGWTLLILLSIGFVAEVPQIARALSGRPPFQLIDTKETSSGPFGSSIIG